MNKNDVIPKLRLLGGPLQRLARHLRLVTAGTNTVRLGVVLGLLAWVVFMCLDLVEGIAAKALFRALMAVQVRLLVVIPLYFLCEAWVVPQLAKFVRNIVGFGVVPEVSLPSLASTIRRVDRVADSSLAEVLLLLAALAMPGVQDLYRLRGRRGVCACLQ